MSSLILLTLWMTWNVTRNIQLERIYTEIRDNLDGEPRMIGAEVVVGVSISGYMISEPQAVYRPYSTDGGTLTLEFSETAPEQLIDTKTAQISLKFTAKEKQPTLKYLESAA